MDEFQTIINDIEKNMEGEGYFCFFHMKSGSVVEGGWKPLQDAYRGLIVIDDNTNPPFYVPIFEIEYIQLSDR